MGSSDLNQGRDLVKDSFQSQAETTGGWGVGWGVRGSGKWSLQEGRREMEERQKEEARVCDQQLVTDL